MCIQSGESVWRRWRWVLCLLRGAGALRGWTTVPGDQSQRLRGYSAPPGEGHQPAATRPLHFLWHRKSIFQWPSSLMTTVHKTNTRKYLGLKAQKIVWWKRLHSWSITGTANTPPYEWLPCYWALTRNGAHDVLYCFLSAIAGHNRGHSSLFQRLESKGQPASKRQTG